jgi:hypothetical protein
MPVMATSSEQMTIVIFARMENWASMTTIPDW